VSSPGWLVQVRKDRCSGALDFKEIGRLRLARTDSV
jgi:hypothetical protein